MEYDYIIVGAGLFGSVFAYEMKKYGKKCLILDKRNHLGGNIYCENVDGINIHKYGPHIFHTDNLKCWEFVCSLVEMNHFVYSPIAIYKNQQFNLPFNMNTFYQLWQTQTPNAAKQIIQKQIDEENIHDPQNMEEQALAMVGKDIYNILIKGYTEKQWGKQATKLPSFIINRIPLRFTYDNNYFNDRYQGIPIGGYNIIINKLLDGTCVRLNTNYLNDKQYFENLGKRIIYTGRIDEFFNYKFGQLEYRSLSFDTKNILDNNYQGCAVVNYTEREIPYTRIIEHKHFEFGTQKNTIITKEYPVCFNGQNEPYYPINDLYNNNKYALYLKLANEQKKYIFCGRLGSYNYADMDDTIIESLKLVNDEIKNFLQY